MLGRKGTHSTYFGATHWLCIDEKLTYRSNECLTLRYSQTLHLLLPIRSSRLAKRKGRRFYKYTQSQGKFSGPNTHPSHYTTYLLCTACASYRGPRWMTRGRTPNRLMSHQYSSVKENNIIHILARLMTSSSSLHFSRGTIGPNSATSSRYASM